MGEIVDVWGQGGIWKLSVLSAQFCCGPEMALKKNKMCLFKKKAKQIKYFSIKLNKQQPSIMVQ